MIGIGFHVPAMAHADTAPLTVLEHILGTEPSGRLYQGLVKTRLASSVIATHQSGYDPGLFGCLVSVNREVPIEKVRESLNELIAAIVSDGVTEEEVNRAIRELANAKEDAQTNVSALAYEMSDWVAYGDWRLFFVDRDRLEQVKPADVQRVASLYFKESNRTTGIFVPTPEPNRSVIAQRPKVDSLVSGYTGRESVSQGESFLPTPENLAARTIRGKLESGLKYLLLPKKVRGDKFYLTLTLRFGNETELANPKSIQACKLLGDIWMRGTEKYSEAALQDTLDELKAECNVASDVGSVTFQVSGRSNKFSETVDLLNELLLHPAFPIDEFELLKTQKRAEMEAMKTDPNSIAENAISRKLNPVSSNSIHYVPTIEELLERLEAAKVSDVIEIYKKLLSGANGELTIVGSFDKEIALKKLNASTTNWKSQVRYARIAKPFLPIEPETLSIETPDKENAVYIAATNLNVRSDDPDWEAMYIANDILGGGSLSSRLGERVREQEGLSYGVGSQFIARHLDRTGVFMTFAITNPMNRDKLVQTIDAVFDELVEKGVTAEEIESSRTSYLKQLEETLSNDTQLMSTLHQYQESNRDESFLSRRLQNMKAVSKESVDAILRKLLNNRKLVVVTAGDFEGKKPASK
jgi:zinc protease